MIRKRGFAPAGINRILVLHLGPIGDTIFAVPALRALRNNYPSAMIAALATPEAGDILAGSPYLDLLRICRNGFELFRAIIECRRLGFDLAVGLSRQGSWAASLCGTPYKAGLPSPLLSFAEPGALKEPPTTHIVEYCLGVIELLGGSIPEEHGLEFWFTEADRKSAESFLATHRAAGPLIAMHPGGHFFPFKRWPLAHFVRLADALAAHGLQVVIVGGSEDAEAAGAIARQAKTAPLLAAGKLRLKETGALISRCQLFIGNDSAPLHMAAAVRTPSIGLFGPTNPAQFRPYGPGNSVVYKALPCSPCYNYLGGLLQYWPRCARPLCMEAISVEEVMAEAAARLHQTAGAGGGLGESGG